MCGRYDNTIAAEAYRRLFGAERLPQSNFPPRYNVAPTDIVPIIRLSRDGERELVMARWGLVPFWMKDIPKKAFINAQSRDGGDHADVPGGICQAPLPHPRDRVLRVAAASVG